MRFKVTFGSKQLYGVMKSERSWLRLPHTNTLTVAQYSLSELRLNGGERGEGVGGGGNSDQILAELIRNMQEVAMSKEKKLS